MGISKNFPEKHFEFDFDEELWYMSASPKANILNIEMSGITHPDPSFHIQRSDTWNFYVIAYLLRGRGWIECVGRRFSLRAGDAFLLGPMTAHEYAADPDDPLEMVWVNASGALITNLLKTYNHTEPVIVRHTDLYADFLRLREHTAEQYDARMAEADIAGLLIALAHSEYDGNDGNLTTPEKLKTYIDNTPGITAETAAAQFRISPGHARRLFREQYGMTVHQYVRERNLTTAKQLLLSSEYSVGEISDRLGYCDDNYFSAVFKKHFGLSPMQFRLQNRAVKKCNTQESPEQRQG
jgi:AraC-like DNA-binding protein